MNPTTKHFARADAGSIDVQSTPTGLTANLAGSVAANAYLGHTGVAVECFQLSQDFEITCSDSKVTAVALTLDSTLVGFVRSKFNGAACIKVASVAVTPAGYPSSPLAVAYPPMCVSGTDGRLCNQHIEPITVQSLPLGKYVLTADLLLEAEASGLCDAHAAADFTSAAALPAEFVRMRDPFQNADKKNFGFAISLTAALPVARSPCTHAVMEGWSALRLRRCKRPDRPRQARQRRCEQQRALFVLALIPFAETFKSLEMGVGSPARVAIASNRTDRLPSRDVG